MEAAETGAFFVPAPGLVLAAPLDFDFIENGKILYPSGITLEASLGGFESKERSIQVIVANFGAPLNEILKGFTEETFKAMGMELKSRGEFTVNGARAFLFKVLHQNDDINWGKWIMLAENGNNTIEVNAVFVSGDVEAASDLEVMLKGVYMEPPRPVSANADAPSRAEISERPVSVTPLSADETPVQPAVKSQDVFAPERAISRDIRSESGTEPAPPERDSTIKPDVDVSADLAKPAGSDQDRGREGAPASNDVSVSPDIGGGDDDKSVRKTKVRLITENGIVSVEDAPAEASDGESEIDK